MKSKTDFKKDSQTEPMVVTTVHIAVRQKTILNRDNINISKLIRYLIDLYLSPTKNEGEGEGK